MIKAGIIGSAGYAGGELIRLLIHHPQVEIVFVHSKSNSGKNVSSVHQDLLGETDLRFTNELSNNIDVLFLCLSHGESKKFLSENFIESSIKIIDLANDFRLHKEASLQTTYSKRQFVYGLPELNRQQIKAAQNIANPGCFATAIQLGLLPLAKAGLLDEVYTTGITGSTGAGQSFASTSHFSWRANNIQAYKTLTHQHLAEIIQSLQQLQPFYSSVEKGVREQSLNFVPWRGDFTRGIFVSSVVHCEKPLEELNALYKNFYAGSCFTLVSDNAVFLKQVINTNKCVVQLEKAGSKLVIHSALDNLLKGASGQAVQNMNLMFETEETAGLKLKSNYF